MVTTDVWRRFCPQVHVDLKKPTLDAFADENNRECERFLSRLLCAGCLAVDAFAHPSLLQKEELIWMYPSFGRLEETLRMVRKLCLSVILV